MHNEERIRLIGMNSSIRKMALDMAVSAGKKGCHIGGSFSSLEIMTVLYGLVLRFDVQNPEWEERDRFIASKSHCILTHFSALSYVGFFPAELLKSFSENGGTLAGHPMDRKLGLEFSGGSLGMGLSIGIGMAIDAKAKHRSNKVYVLLGDGECDEGSIWEGFMAAPKFKLDNLIVVIDFNLLQYDGNTDDIMDLGDMAAKLHSFGWETRTIDGHNIDALYEAFMGEHKGKPYAIIAKTIKAHSIYALEGKAESHHAEMTLEMYNMSLAWKGE